MRIRTIKPDFWISELIGSFSLEARLAYIWMWTAADDEGRLRLTPALLRAGAFAFDDMPLATARRVLVELSSRARVILYRVDDQSYGFLPHFREHQKIDRPSRSALPSPEGAEIIEFDEGSSSPRRALVAGKERKGKEGKGSVSDPSDPHSGKPEGGGPDPAEQVFEFWKQTMGHEHAKLDPKRKATIQRALRTYSTADLCKAVSGCAKTPHNMGQNERGERYDSIELILRDAAHIDRFTHNDDEPPTVGGPRHKSSAELLAEEYGLVEGGNG